MFSSDSDDRPLALHRQQKVDARTHCQNVSRDKSRSPSPLPDWLSQSSTPAKPIEMLDDSDDAADTLNEPHKATIAPDFDKWGAKAVRKQSENGTKATGVKRSRAVLHSSSDSEGSDAKQSPQKRPKTTTKAQKKALTPAQASKPGKLQRKGITAFLQKPGISSAEPEDRLAEPTKAPEPAGASQTLAPQGSNQLKTGSQQVKALPESTKGIAAVEGEVPIMMPSKLATNKVIMELQCGGEAEAVDLSGDAGVVGRWLVQGDNDSPQLCMDLKGVLFSATTVPCASTLCVVNLTATEAKVEVLASEFLQLRPDASQGGLGADNPQDDYFMYDDDENYQYEGGTQAKGKTDEAGAGPAGRAKKQKPGAAGKKPAKKKLAGAKAVRKKPGKAAAGAKGKKRK